MADQITERTAELEQGLDELQSTVEARTAAPPVPFTQPAAPVDPNTAPPVAITQVYVEPPSQPAAADDHPTWDQITTTPEYKAANPTEKLLTFSRWHDATYDMLQDHPDWPSIKDQFNNNAALKEQELSKDAGGATPDQARADIAKKAVKDAGATTPQDERNVLAALGPDFARSYLNDKLGVKAEVAPDEKLVNAAMANGLTRDQAVASVNKNLESKPTSFQEFGAHIMLRNSSMLNNSLAAGAKLVAPLLNESGQRTVVDAAQYFQHNADITDAAFQQKEGGVIDPTKSDSVPNIIADTLGTMLATAPATAATMLVPEATIPAAIGKVAKMLSIGARATGYMVKAGKISANMIPVGMEFAGDASNKAYSEAIAKDPKDVAGAEKAATAAALSSLAALPAFAVGLSAAGVVESKLLPQLLNPVVRGGARFITGTLGNLLATEGLKVVEGQPLGLTKHDIISSATFAAHPAVEAAKSEAHDAAAVPQAQSIMKGTDAHLQIFDRLAQDDTSLTEAQRKVAADSAAAMRKGAADFLASRKIEPEKPDVATAVQVKAAENAQQDAPQVAEVLNQIAQAPDEAVVKAAEKTPAKEAAPVEVTLGHEMDASGDRIPKIEVPPGAKVEDLQAAKKEVDASYPKDSAEANEFHRQLDEAIAEKEKEFAPASATEPLDQPELNQWRNKIQGNLENARLFLDRAEPRTDAAEQMKQDLLDRKGIPAEQELIKNTDFSNLKAVQDLQDKLKGGLKPAASAVSPEEIANREAQNEQHKAAVAARNPQPKTPVAKEAVEAIKNGNLNDITYDGRGMVGEQFTEIDPRSPSHGATFEVPTNASLHDILERRIELRDKFAGKGEEPRGSTTERTLEKPELSALNKQAYADAQEMKRKSGRGKDFDVTAAYNARRVQLLKEARANPAPEIPKAGEGATRAEKSAANKAAHRAEQQAASAKRKEARAKAPGMAEAQDQVTIDTVKRGVVPGLDEIQEAHPAMDITTAQDLRRKLQGELTKAYPPEAVPEGSKVTNLEHDYTKEELPMIETKDADGVTRTRPQFTNDPEITAQQKDQGLFSDDAGNRLYIPDELLDNEQVNPAISNHMKWDPEAKQYYVGVVDTALGRVHVSHEEALGNQGVRAGEQQRSYTQLRQEQDAFGKAHAHIAVGDKLEAVSEAVRQHAEERGLDEDSIQYDSAPEEGPKTEIGVQDETDRYITKLSRRVSENIAKEQMDEADDLGLIQHVGRTRVNLNDVLDRVIADPKTPTFMREIAKLIKSSGFDLSHMRPNIVSNPGERYGGRYWHQSNTMEFNLAGGRHLGGVRTTFMHELLHGILDAKMEPDAKRNPAEQRAYEVITKLHDTMSRIAFEARKGRPPESVKELEAFQEAQYGHYEHTDNMGRKFYGLSNPFEFVTETLTNPEFQNWLNENEHTEPVLLEGEIVGRQKGEALPTKSKFQNIIDTVKNAIMTLFGGKEITPTSPLRSALEQMLTMIKEGPAQQTVAQITLERARKEIIKFQDGDAVKKDLQKLFDEANKGKEYKPDLNKVKDKQGLNRAERSKINKQAYAEAQAEAKRQGKGFDVMKEYERRREEIIADFKKIGLATTAEQTEAERVAAGYPPSQTFTAEGKAKMQEVRARQAAEKGDTGMTQEELNAEIAGEEAPTEPQLTGEPQKPVLQLLNRVEGNGWVTPEGKFLPVDERYHQGLTAGVNPLVFGGHGSHGSAAWEYIQSKPELASAFDQAAKDKGYGSILDMSESDVKDFLEARGFLRVLHDNTNTYFTGKRGVNDAGEKMLMDHAQENGRTLIHDRETGDPRNSLKELYRPAHLQGAPDALGFFEPRGSATEEPTAAEEEQAKVKYTSRAGGRRNISIEGVPNKAQVEATMNLIDSDEGASDTVKSVLKDQVAIAAKRQEPTLVDRLQVRVPLKGQTILKDTGADIIVAGADSAIAIPQIMGQQGGTRVALGYGSAKKPSKEVLMDRVASYLIVDHGKDLHALEVGRDQVANGAESGKQFLPQYDYAIENFGRLKDKKAHDDTMREQAEREQTYDIPTKILENYVSRQLESPDMSDNDMIGVPNGKGGTRYFTKSRSFETMSDALAAGFVPKTLDIVEADAMRIEAGERLIQQKILHESLKSVLAPDGRPIIGTTEPRQTLYRGEVDVVPKGYQMVQVPGGGSIVVHSEYAPLIEAMYGKSYTGAFAKWAGFMKKNTLILDTFHVGRILMKQAAFSKGLDRGPMAYQKGLSLLEYRKEDLKQAVEVGDISQAQHDYAMEHYEDAQALIRNGLNVGKMSDNMNAELIKGIPYLRNFNPWVFSKLSRGAMLQSALRNLERNQSRFGDELSRDEVLRKTAIEMNEVFGNLNMQSIVKNKQFQSSLRAILLAPQWAESQLKSEFRGYAQLLKAPIDLIQGKARLGVVAQGQMTAVIGMFAAMQVASMVLNGHTTFQNKKGDWLNIHIPGGRAGFEFNPLEIGAEYAFMIARYRSQHMALPDIAQRITFNKLNPAPHGVLNWMLNRDYSGKRYADWADRNRALAESVIPLPPLFSAGLERDPRQKGLLSTNQDELKAVRTPADAGRLLLHTAGIRPTRYPGALEKSLLQSSGIKVSAAQTPRTEMFSLSQPYRDDKSYGDNAPPVYRELRAALDNRNDSAVREEITLLASRGATEDQIKKAVGATHGGIAPEKFTGKKDVEHLFVKALTPDQRKIYNEAQADHKANARLLLSTLSQMKTNNSELVKQLHKNRQKPKASDFQN